MEQLNKWLEANNLILENIESVDPPIISVGGFKFLILSPNEEGLLFDRDFHLIIPEGYRVLIFDYYLFEFGGKYFYTPKGSMLKPSLNLFKYIGKYNTKIDIPFIHLGIHGKYEILNGSRNYSDWCSKAKWLGAEALGICEENTLGGIIHFQIACDEVGIKPIFGETLILKIGGAIYPIKLYALTREGWKIILRINKFVNVDNYENRYIEYPDFITSTKPNSKENGLACVLPNDFPLTESIVSSLRNIFDSFLFYQVDTVRWESPQTDINYLNNIKNYLNNYYPKLQPILINDSYYLDKEEAHIKGILNKIGNKGHIKTSIDQYFKSVDDSFEILQPLFKDTDMRFDSFMESIFLNTKKIADNTEFKLTFGEFHLPTFDQSHLPKEYRMFYEDRKSNLDISINEQLFDYILKEGMEEVIEKGKVKREDEEKYWNRVAIEKELIKKGGFIDYFLILWDIVRWCKENDILTGFGRGSAVGSVVAWLLDITKMDPIPSELLFERFLNEGRLKSLPDIDVDFESRRRDEVKSYLESIYGKDFVCSVGAYKTLKIKSGLKDLDRIKGGDYKTVNFLTKSIYFKEQQDSYIEELFIAAQQFSPLKEYIQKNIQLVHDLSLILELPYASSVHPCATIILPNYEGEDIFDWIPVRNEDNEGYVSEWEGPELEKIGFLKEDILGLNQLDKFSNIIELIKQSQNEDIGIYDLPIDDPKVLDYFKKGWTSDIFQFGSSGLTQYCREVKPDSVEELTTMVALFRPGPIQSGAHFNYVNYKFGYKEPNYDYGLMKVTASTYGLYVFQEQVMKAVEVLGGFSSEETDDVRRAMGKKKLEVLEPYKKKFIDHAIEQGCEEVEAETIWQKLEVFSGYGFNKSHAAAYAFTGYISQWLKCHYPLQFWITAFEFAEDDSNILRYMAEIKKIGDPILIVPPDINNSLEKFTYDLVNWRIYWSLLKIKFLGEVGVNSIIKERDKGGKFFSFEEAYKRLKDKEGITSRTFKVLIISGAFDEIESISDVKARKLILNQFYKLAKIDPEEDGFLEDINHINDWWWLLKQKELTGLGDFNYSKFLLQTHLSSYKFISPEEIELESSIGNLNGVVAGIVREVKFKTSKKGAWTIVELDCNNSQIFVNFWNNESKLYEDELSDCVGKIMFVQGEVKLDKFRGQNVIHVSENGKLDFLFALPVEKKKKGVVVKKGDNVEFLLPDFTETLTGIIVAYPSNDRITVETEKGEKIVINKKIIIKIV